jgi:hypothetical protein
MLLCAVFGSVWYAWVPISALLATDDSKDVVYGGIGESGDESKGEDMGLAELFQHANERGQNTSRTFRYAPQVGAFLSVDLVRGEVTAYRDGLKEYVCSIEKSPAQGAPNTLKEGRFFVTGQGEVEVSTLALVRFPYYIRFGDRFAFHGPPTDEKGVPLADSYVDGSILLSLEDAKVLYGFATSGVEVHVRLDAQTPPYVPYTQLVVQSQDIPATSAVAYVVADLARGQVVLEKQAGKVRPIASITKLITAVVAGGRIGNGVEVLAPNGEQYAIGDLLYPLLLRSDNAVAESLASHVGTRVFMREMNAYVRNLGMEHTSFTDASGLSPGNRSSAYDLVTFARHLYMDKRYVLDISKVDSMTITSKGGIAWSMVNQNKLAGDRHFVGGKLGFTDEAGQTSVAIFTVPVGKELRTIAIVVLGSVDWKQDTRTLLRWLLENVEVSDV